jgi:hypothetical protein
MKPLFALLALTTAVIAGDTFDDMLLRNGTVLKNVEVKEITDRGLKVTHKDGSGLIKTEQLPAEVKKRYAARIAAAAKAAPAKDAPGKPVEPPAPPKTAPEKSGGVIAGLEPSTVVQLCGKLGLTTSTRAGTAGNEWIGSLKDDTADIHVTAAGPNASSVSTITATVVSTGTPPGSTRAPTVLGSLAALSYTGADPAKAKQWVSDNIDTDDAKTTIGGVSFHVTARASASNARVLRIARP